MMKQDDKLDAKLFPNIEDARLNDMRDTLEVARKNGYDVFQEEQDGKVTCGKHSTSTHVLVYPDGSWVYTDSTPENPAAHDVTEGINAAFLRMFFFDVAQYLDVAKGEA